LENAHKKQFQKYTPSPNYNFLLQEILEIHLKIIEIFEINKPCICPVEVRGLETGSRGYPNSTAFKIAAVYEGEERDEKNFC